MASSNQWSRNTALPTIQRWKASSVAKRLNSFMNRIDRDSRSKSSWLRLILISISATRKDQAIFERHEPRTAQKTFGACNIGLGGVEKRQHPRVLNNYFSNTLMRLKTLTSFGANG